VEPAPLNRQPLGLLGFMGIKNGGENPRTLANVLQPVIDLTSLYTIPASVIGSSSSTFTATGLTLWGPALQTDPDVWVIHNASIYVDASTAGDSVTFNIGIVDTLNTFVPITPMLTVAAAWGGMTIPENTMLAPGQALAVRVHAGLVFPHPWVGAYRATRLRN